MGRVLTNNTAFAYAVESSIGVLPGSPTWRRLEPNNITTFGPTITTVARQPITDDRQRRKGTITDLDSAIEIEHDVVLDPFADLSQRFVFATAVNEEMNIPVSAAETTGDTYTVAALSAAQADKLEFTALGAASLIVGRGFAFALNNGLKQVDADIATSATAISVAENLADEPSPPANARLEFAGVRLLAGSNDLTWDWDGGTLTAQLISAGDVTDWGVFGFTVGQRIHVGSRDSAGAIQNAFQNSVANDMFGFARIRTIAGGTMTLDKVDAALRFDDLTSPATDVDIIGGRFVRNVAASATAFLQESIQAEAAWANLADPGPGDEYEYALGNFSNTLGFQLPLTDKAIFTAGFIGTDTEAPTGTRKTNADTPLLPNGTEAFNTSIDIARISVEELDEDGVSTFFKSLNLNLNNNVSPEKVLGTLGAAFTNFGDFEVDLETQALFTNGNVLAAIRANTTVTLDFVLRNTEATIYVDVPSMTLGGGGRDLPRNETVLVNFTGQAFRDETFGTSIGITIFPIRL